MLALVKIFFPCSQSASYMLSCKSGIDLQQSISNILMYRTFAHAKLLGCLPDCCIIFHDISCNLYCSFFDIFFQRCPQNLFFTLYAGVGLLILLLRYTLYSGIRISTVKHSSFREASAAPPICSVNCFTMASPNPVVLRLRDWSVV